MRTWVLRAGAACVICLSASPRLPASDDAAERLFDEINGRRVPRLKLTPNPMENRSTGAPASVRVDAASESATSAELAILTIPQPVDPDVTYAVPPRLDRSAWLGKYPITFVQAVPPVAPDYNGGDPLIVVPGRWARDSYIERREYERWRDTRERHQEEMAEHKERLLSSHEKALQAGLAQLSGREFAGAVVSFTLACELNHGDPAARVHLAQARMALGHYAEGGKVLRRALDLQPKLAYVPLRLASYHGAEGEFDADVDALSESLRTNGGDADEFFLAGFMEFQRGNFERAHRAFRKVAQVQPGDELTAMFLDMTRPARR